MTRPSIPARATGPALLLLLLLLFVLVAVPATPAAGQQGAAARRGEVPDVPWERPLTWPEEQRAFVQDGPAWLLPEATLAELLGADEAGRRAIIDAFLSRDPDPSTAENELVAGIERRRQLVREEIGTFNDDRARLLFLHGRPIQRVVIDCATVYRPLEIWSYVEEGETPAWEQELTVEAGRAGDPDVVYEDWAYTKAPFGTGDGEVDPNDPTAGAGAKFLVLFQPADDEPYKLWEPLDAKRALYTSQFEYIMEQYEEVRRAFRGRPDRIVCERTRLVEHATGVRALTGYRRDRPRRENYEAWLRPPAPDALATWSTAAAATPLAVETPDLGVSEVAVYYPAARDQRMVSQFHVTLPADAGYGTAEAEVSGNPQLRLLAEGRIEQGGQAFDDFRVRFRPPPPEEGRPLTLIFERQLRPGLLYLVRMEVRDEVTGARAYPSIVLEVPSEANPEAIPGPAADAAQATGRDLEETRHVGQDTLTLLPPVAETVIKVWRASVLVAGDRIERVAFYVDGERQLDTARRPFSAELRLADLPREQVVRAEGYDGDGNLVAIDEVVVNRARAAFSVRIVTPAEGAQGMSGPVEVEADVSVPDEKRLAGVEFRLDEEPVANFEEPPFTAEVEVPSADEVAYLTVVAQLEDGTRTEAVRLLNAEEGFAEQLEVQLVELYVAATGSDGRLVRGLGPEDFRVFDQGEEQQIQRFELMDSLPLTLGLAIDTSGSMSESIGEAKRAAIQFLSRVVEPGDRSFALAFADFPNLLMPPTSDVEVVAQAVDGLRANGSTVLHDGIVTALSYFRELEGQQALVLLSDGDDTASTFEYKDALDYARRSEVSVYTIGLQIPATALQIRSKLRRLAEESGGRSFFISSADELEDVYEQIEEELRSRYLLVYTPKPSPEPGSGFREVEVRSTERGVRTRTVRGYYP